MHPDAIGMQYAWHAEARAEGCIDRTVYGASRTATTSFFTHHLRLISLAAVIGAGCARRRVKGSPNLRRTADRLVPESCWTAAAGLPATTAASLSASLRSDRR